MVIYVSITHEEEARPEVISPQILAGVLGSQAFATAREDGLSALCLSSNLSLDSGWYSLGTSLKFGRIIVCGKAGSSDNFN